MAKHKSLGQVFTPNWIISEILDLVGYNDDSIIDTENSEDFLNRHFTPNTPQIR